MYKREATEYDTDYVKKYDEDLNTTLIFVRSPSCALTNHLTCLVLAGGSVFCRQLGVRHRCPLKPPTRSEPPVRDPPPRHPPYSQSVRHPRRDPRRPTRSERSASRDCHCHKSHVRESPDLAAGRIRRNVGKTMAKPVLAQFGRVDDRALWGPSTQMRWT